ncbi:MAG TPA: DUF6289 family protein [Thermoanaerobaculia bacterium]|jgi:hypothetical protein|nr:DUF6289 family protein [Thermoanaerobaculia bacterium]
MKRVKTFLKSRGALLAIVAVVLGSTLGLTSPVKVAQSATCAWRPIIRTYYSDATHTTVVGERGLNCNCDDISWGVTSSFVVNTQQCCSFFTC